MNLIFAIDLLFAVLVAASLAAICRLGYVVAGGRLEEPAAAPVPRRFEAPRRAA